MSDKQVTSNLPPLSGGGRNWGSNGGASQQTVSLQQVLATAQGLNVLTTGAGQQFVITSQVPGLTQVIPSSATTNANVQQVGVTRIVNIGGTSPRVSVVGVASGSSLSSSSHQNPTKVVLATSPKLVRASMGNMFVTPSSQASVQSPPARKKLRLTETTEKVTAIDDSVGYRRRIMEHKIKRMRAIREKYAENASELFFLHAGGNMMDFQTWKKRPPTPQYLHFLRQHRLDPDDDDEDLTMPLPPISEVSTSPTVTTSSSMVPQSQSAEVKMSGIGVTPVAVSTTLPAAVAQLSQQGGTPIVPDPPKPIPTVSSSPVADTLPITSTSVKSPKSLTPILATQPVVKLVKLPSSTVTTSCDIPSNQEQIVEKAKQEAYVMQRISELQREGLWSERRLPKVQEPSRTKAHWDYLLEEMVWLAADFAQERKWKKAAAKKCARMVQKHFQEKAIQAQKAEKSQELRLKKIAGFVAKEIKTFWTNVEKLVEYKQQTRLEEKRKKALDQHLNFIVGQTEKYSTWLTEGLNKTDGAQSVSASMNSSRISSPIMTAKQHSDDEFEPNQSSDDDEETIAKAEEEMKSMTNHKEEVELLKRESELPLEDLLKELPPNYLEERSKSLSPAPRKIVVENEHTVDEDTDFMIASDESSDDEDTIMEQEKLEGSKNHEQELDDLKAENEMSIDELMAKYGNMPDDMDVDDQDTDEESTNDSEKEEDKENEERTESESESEDETKDENSQTQSDDETSGDLKLLLEDLSSEKPNEDKNTSAEQCDTRNEMDDVAALAESIQPKGNTLLTTSVVTKIPFLLKHSLREYQHIGLDWLVTMYDRKLNGILADEMGLGKTIQTIALLAHLACEKGNWGPHLIIVPTSVMLNWEMECKKWCPGFKILTYYGTQKERKQKRTGWTKPNAFHICITSYKLVIQDHQSFRRKKWKYLILDEAQNIKNFKSQRWQLLLNFQTQRRLLLTGTPLQNNLMELWSLMHFLMPNVFQSHREFKEWFSNPVTGMIEGNSEYNENIIRRLHKVLRPFLLRRLKTEVEKQLPKKYEHVIMCRLSKRQRYLYDDFMSRAKTKETLASGNLLSVINVLMQLRKVCNHPNLFELRPTVSPFQMEAIEFVTASLVSSILDYDPFKQVDLSCVNLLLVNLELTLTAFVAHRVRRLQTPRKLIEEINSQPDPPPRCPPGKIKINVRLSNQTKVSSTPQQAQTKLKNLTGILPTPRVGTSPLIKSFNNQSTSGQGVTLRVAGGQQLQGYSVQLVQHQGSVKAIPVGTLSHNPQSTATVTSSTSGMNAQRITVGNANIRDGLQRLAAQTVTVKQGDSVQRIAVPSFAQLVQTSTGRHIILTSNQQNTNAVSFPVMTPSGQRLTVLSKSLMGLSTSVTTVNKVVGGVVTTATTTASARPVMRVPPLNVTTSQAHSVLGVQQPQQQQLRCGVVTRNTQKESEKGQTKEQPKSEFYIPQLEEERRQRRQGKLNMIANVNEMRCTACPLYGEDLFTALRISRSSTSCWHGNGWMHCATAKDSVRTRRQFFSRTEVLAESIRSTEQIVEELKEVFERFVVCVPAVRAPSPRFHVSHPPPHKLWAQRRVETELQRQLSPKLTLFHPVSSAMATQFPDPRLIQYDCGKLQSLDRLLRKLKSDSHRVLIFTQMTRMLDVLEAFLNFHGHIYLRLDGTTKVDQRQMLMERFNGDKRIFCFILSTRSGGVGVNLTGADTVIFYDSDWNPTMDAQAQDRCHRIGQTRDVHIYRLVSEKTVEENILKKANQKRLLGDLAIEGGNFTTAYFKSSTIQDLFNIDQSENDASTRMAEVLDRNKDWEKVVHKEPLMTSVLLQQSQPTEDKAAMGALESALAAAEEDLDVQAAKTAKAEAVADLAEFDENIPLDEADKDDAQISKAEQEVQNLVSQLTPVERYAMKFVEESEGTFSAAQLAAAERELEQQKREWELDRLRALREEEERRLRMADDDEVPLTFGREDAQNQVNNTSNSKKLVKKSPPSRRSSRKHGSRSARESSESETDTTTESESDSQEDVVEDSPDEESSHTESQSQEDEGEEGDSQNESERGSYSKSRNRSDKSIDKNHLDLNSPRTRSRGNVKINLWTLDVSPILPGVKPQYTPTRGLPRKRGRPRSDEIFALPLSPITISKKSVNTSTSTCRSDAQFSNQSKRSNASLNLDTEHDNSVAVLFPKYTQASRIETDKSVKGTKILGKSNVSEYSKTVKSEVSSSKAMKPVKCSNKSLSSNKALASKAKPLDKINVNENLSPKYLSTSSSEMKLLEIPNLIENVENSNTNNVQSKRSASPKVKIREKSDACTISQNLSPEALYSDQINITQSDLTSDNHKSQYFQSKGAPKAVRSDKIVLSPFQSSEAAFDTFATVHIARLTQNMDATSSSSDSNDKYNTELVSVYTDSDLTNSPHTKSTQELTAHFNNLKTDVNSKNENIESNDTVATSQNHVLHSPSESMTDNLNKCTVDLCNVEQNSLPEINSEDNVQQESLSFLTKRKTITNSTKHSENLKQSKLPCIVLQKSQESDKSSNPCLSQKYSPDSNSSHRNIKSKYRPCNKSTSQTRKMKSRHVETQRSSSPFCNKLSRTDIDTSDSGSQSNSRSCSPVLQMNKKLVVNSRPLSPSLSTCALETFGTKSNRISISHSVSKSKANVVDESSEDENIRFFSSVIQSNKKLNTYIAKSSKSQINKASAIQSTKLVTCDSNSHFAIPTTSSMVPKSVGCSELKTKFRRPDTPLPGVLTRSAKVNSNAEYNNPVTKSIQTRRPGTPYPVSDCKRITRLSGSQPNVINADCRVQSPKPVSKVVQMRRPDTPPCPMTEQGRITRSSVNRSVTPPHNAQKFNKPLEKRRPDTPFPDFFHSSTRPVTRSHVNTGLSAQTKPAAPSFERPLTRSSKLTSDSNFLVPTLGVRKSGSISLAKQTSETVELVPVSSRLTRKSFPNTNEQSNYQKRRSGTPLPVLNRLSRVTRSGIDFSVQSDRPFSPLPKVKGVRKAANATSDSKIRRSVSPPVSLVSTRTLDMDSNENAVNFELNSQGKGSTTNNSQRPKSNSVSSARQMTECSIRNASNTETETFLRNDKVSTLLSETNDKPQRTAKVVAILTLDSLSRNHHNVKTTSTVQTKTSSASLEMKSGKKNLDNCTKKSEISSESSNQILNSGISNLLSARVFIPAHEQNEIFEEATVSKVGLQRTESASSTDFNSTSHNTEPLAFSSGVDTSSSLSTSVVSLTTTRSVVLSNPTTLSDRSKKTSEDHRLDAPFVGSKTTKLDTTINTRQVSPDLDGESNRTSSASAKKVRKKIKRLDDGKPKQIQVDNLDNEQEQQPPPVKKLACFRPPSSENLNNSPVS